jgi:CheY-like chemotaxis protein
MAPAGERKALPTLGVLVLEALKRRASPDERAHIMARAFKAAGISELPEDPGELGWFVTGPLADAVARIVGTNMAEELITELEPIVNQPVEQRDSDVRPRDSAPPDFTDEDAAATVLVVDDDDAMRQRLSKALRRVGHRVVTSRDGLTALAICVRHRPCCVVADLRGAGAGAQLCTAIRTALGEASPPVVMLTHEALSAVGVVTLPREPFELDVLVELVDDATR